MKFLVLLTLLFAFNANAQITFPGDGGHGDQIGFGGAYLVEREIHCASNGYENARCYTGLDRTQRVYLARQLSKSACIEGQTFQAFGDRIDVWSGCRAIFVARGLTSQPLPNDNVIDDGGWGHGGGATTVRILCESKGYNTTSCRIPLRRVREVYLAQQHSKSSCIEGQSYFISDRYIQVSNGCRATFIARGRE